MNEAKELSNREIRGITARQIIWAIFAVASGALLYFNVLKKIEDAQRISEETNYILREISSDRKEEKRIIDATLKTIEQNQKQIEIRLSILETTVQRKP